MDLHVESRRERIRLLPFGLKGFRYVLMPHWEWLRKNAPVGPGCIAESFSHLAWKRLGEMTIGASLG